MGGVNGAIRACMNHEGLVTAPPPPPGVSQALRPLEREVRSALQREPNACRARFPLAAIYR